MSELKEIVEGLNRIERLIASIVEPIGRSSKMTHSGTIKVVDENGKVIVIGSEEWTKKLKELDK